MIMSADQFVKCYHFGEEQYDVYLLSKMHHMSKGAQMAG